MPNSIATGLIESGIIQFGWFKTGNQLSPVRFSTEYLPAYPYLMKAILTELKKRLNFKQDDRILTTQDALPLAIGLALEYEISVIYNQPNGKGVAFEFIGAYTSGQSAILLTCAPLSNEIVSRLISQANSAGLVVNRMVGIISAGETQTNQLSQPIEYLIRLEDCVKELVHEYQVPEGQINSVLQWLQQIA